MPLSLSLSQYSSMGPTPDGRIKPDVVGTGFKIVSAMSGGSASSSAARSCGLYESFGTSMATPVVAGGALLLRDYFSSLWSTVCDASYAYCHSFVPSGYLLKAVLIHSAVPVASYSDPMFDHKTELASFTLSGTAPDSVQGYGAVNLHSIVPLTTAERNSHDLYVADQTAVAAGSTVTLWVVVTDNSQPLKVSVVWFDMPSAANTASNLLLLNLDLQVQSAASSAVWYGNGVNADTLNPQEQVFIAAPAAGYYYVRITNTGGSAIKAGIVVTCHGRVEKEAATQGVDLEQYLEQQAQHQAEQRQEQTTLEQESRRQQQQAEQQQQTDYKEPTDLVNAAMAAIQVQGTATTTTTDNGSGSESGSASAIKEVSRLSTVNNIINYAKTFAIANTLSAMSSLKLGSLDITSSGHQLVSIDIRLDASYIVGSEAFILAFVVYTPNGEIVQVGGYNQFVTTDRYLNRMAPVHFTQLTAPVEPDSSSSSSSSSQYYSYSRTLTPLGLSQLGTYQVYAELLHSTWADTTYHGTVTLNFDVTTAAPSRSPTRVPTVHPTPLPTMEAEAGSSQGEKESSTRGTALAGVVVFCAALVVSFLGALMVVKHRQRQQLASVRERERGNGEEGGAVVRSPLQMRHTNSTTTSAPITASTAPASTTGSTTVSNPDLEGASPAVMQLMRAAADGAKAKVRRGRGKGIGPSSQPQARYSRASTQDDGSCHGIDV